MKIRDLTLSLCVLSILSVCAFGRGGEFNGQFDPSLIPNTEDSERVIFKGDAGERVKGAGTFKADAHFAVGRLLDPQTGLFTVTAFLHDLNRAVDDAKSRGNTMTLARFSFPPAIDRRANMDAARLVSRLVRSADFACRANDGSILLAFSETALRSAHVVARRLASVLKHTMLRADRERPDVSPAVTLATLKPNDSLHTLMARVAPRPVASA